MPFNGSGTFSLTYNWATEQASSPIEIAKLDTQESDIASGLSNCILRDGTGLPSTTIPWNSQSLTGVANLSAERVTVTASTVPANGMYLSAANTVAWATNTTARWSIDSAGILASTSTADDERLRVQGTGSPYISLYRSGSRLGLVGGTTGGVYLYGDTGVAASLYAGGVQRLAVGSSGNVTIAAPSSGDALTVNAASSSYGLVIAQQPTTPGLRISNGSGSMYMQASGGNSIVGTDGAWGLDLYTNSTQRLSVGSAGNVTINAPSSGTALAVTGISGTAALSGGLVFLGEAVGLSTGANVYSTSTNQLNLGTNGAAATNLFTNATARLQIASAGNVTINAPSSGVTLTANVLDGQAVKVATTGTSCWINLSNATDANGWIGYNGSTLQFQTAASNRLLIGGLGNVTINAPSSGVALAVSGVSGTHSVTIADSAGTGGFKAGYLGVPQNSQSANYTCVLADAGKHILHPSGGGAGDTFTIPANGSVAYDIGTTLTFVNADSNSVSIAITTDTMTLAGTTTTGTRTLAQNGVATAIKVGSTSWIISGSGLS